MKKLNIIAVYNKDKSKILMCERKKEPYKGKINLVGGKVEKDETEISAAYRELEEETGITSKDIHLTYVMNFQYKILDIELEVFTGILKKDVNLIEEVNKLLWINKNENFYDLEKFAGEGNIWHIIKHIEIYMNNL
ncbi:MAG TPA: NUDIX domain-containing protein [Candidatus Scatovivens faecipullorum]|nr:NUDIX domain-containing protein [Candidatus Scatovivens faecipullorum]